MEPKAYMLNFTECEWEKRSDFAKLLVYQGAKNVTVAVGQMLPGGPHKAHSHLYEQVLIVVKGIADLHLGDHIVHMTPGCIFAIPPHQIHMFEPTGEAPVTYIDIFTPKRPDHKGIWVDPLGVERETTPGEERVESSIAKEIENRADGLFFG